MNAHPKSLLLSAFVFYIGDYYLPATVVLGSIVGASVFIMYRHEMGIFKKAAMFVLSFFCGLFAGDDASEIINKITPQRIDLDSFAGAVVASALSVCAIQALHRAISSLNLKFKFWHKDPPL